MQDDIGKHIERPVEGGGERGQFDAGFVQPRLCIQIRAQSRQLVADL